MDQTQDQVSNWTPLLKLVGEADTDNYMLMGNDGDIVMYKHRMTRSYLNIDRFTGKTYAWDSDSRKYTEVPEQVALKHVRS
ncbi:MAG: hypothetical protein ABSE51_19995 [Terracidiphilus sp.]